MRLVFAIALVLPLCAQAQKIYRCTIDGKVVIQDVVCPSGAASQEVRITYAPATEEDKRRADNLVFQRRMNADFEALVQSGRVAVGMNATHVLRAWGAPKKINRTLHGGRVHEQAVYGGDRYVYIENGIVVSIQESIRP